MRVSGASVVAAAYGPPTRTEALVQVVFGEHTSTIQLFAKGRLVSCRDVLLGRQDFVGEALRHGKEEPVAPAEIALPFAVGEEIGAGGFDFDAPDLALGAEGADIHAQTVAGGEFGQRGEAVLGQHPADAAGEGDARLLLRLFLSRRHRSALPG